MWNACFDLLLRPVSSHNIFRKNVSGFDADG